MASLEEIEDLTVEILNDLVKESEEEAGNKAPTEAAKPASPPRAQPTAESESNIIVTAGSRELAENDESDDEDDEDIDETLLERLVGLTEMFPASVQNATSKMFFGSISTVKGLYSFARSASWILFSTSTILFAPIIFEVERAQMEEMQKQQQRQILLGPGAAMSGGPAGIGMAPPLPPR